MPLRAAALGPRPAPTRRVALRAGAAWLAASTLPGLTPASAATRDRPFATGVIARHGDGAIALDEVTGARLLPGGGRAPFAADQPFRVASISKLITAAGALIVAGQHQIGLDADIAEALGWPLRHPRAPATPITLRALLSHQSGLRNGADFPVPFDEDLRRALTASPPEAGWWGEAPGSFTYSDTNFAVAATMMETLTGARFDRLMTQLVLAPAGLDAGYNWSGVSAAARDRAAPCVRLRDGRWQAEVDGAVPTVPDVAVFRSGLRPDASADAYVPGTNGFAFAPHGGLRASLADLDALAGLLAADGRRGGRAVLPAGVAATLGTPVFRADTTTDPAVMQGGVFRAYGLGTHIPTGARADAAGKGDTFFGPGSADWRGHFGDAYGVLAGLFWNTRSGATLVYVVNGMPETGRELARRTALAAAEEAVIDRATRRLNG